MTPTDPLDFPLAAKLLWMAIPPAARPKVKTQKTWKTLEAGRQLRLLTRWYDGKEWREIGETFTVQPEITNKSIRLLADGDKNAIIWTREWKGTFEKVPKRRTPRK